MNVSIVALINQPIRPLLHTVFSPDFDQIALVQYAYARAKIVIPEILVGYSHCLSDIGRPHYLENDLV